MSKQAAPQSASYLQDSPDWEPEWIPDEYQHPDNNSFKGFRGRGSKGDRKGQAARYYQRYKARRRRYMRDYMRKRRAARSSLVD